MAAVQVAGGGAALDRVGVAAVRRQAVDAAHDQLPLLAVGANARAEQLVRDQVRDFVGHGLFQEVLAVLAVQLGIEAQQVLVEMGDPGFLAAQAEADGRAGEAALEEVFGLPIAGLDAGVEVFGHSGRLQQRAIMPETGGRAQASGRPLVRGAGSGKRGGGQEKPGGGCPRPGRTMRSLDVSWCIPGRPRCPRGSPTGRSSPPAPPGPPPAPSWRTGSLRPCGCS